MTTEAGPPRDVQRFAAYFRAVADMLGLKEWQIDLKDEEPEDKAEAEVLCVYGREWAVINVSDNFINGPESKQRHLVIHELIHCTRSLSDGIAEDMLNKQQRDVYRRAMEWDVDRHAKAIAPLFPLPSEILGPIPAADESSSVIAHDTSAS